ncbi:MAG: SDR family oxidoreductase [Cyclobacteriaceae bacterium]
MKILIVGATGQTGKHLVAQLLNQGQQVKAVVRSKDRLPAEIRNHSNLEFTETSLFDLTDRELENLVAGCDAIGSCLGHSKIYDQPRKLVTDTVRKLCKAVIANKPSSPVKYVLMNTTGNANKNLDEKFGLSERLILAIVRTLIPPHVDNEQAAEYLRSNIGQNHASIEWVIVRPDNLTTENEVTPYSEHPSPTRNMIFDAGKTSRINVGHFMSGLITDKVLWRKWKGQMPVIYNK